MSKQRTITRLAILSVITIGGAAQNASYGQLPENSAESQLFSPTNAFSGSGSLRFAAPPTLNSTLELPKAYLRKRTDKPAESGMSPAAIKPQESAAETASQLAESDVSPYWNLAAAAPISRRTDQRVAQRFGENDTPTMPVSFQPNAAATTIPSVARSSNYGSQGTLIPTSFQNSSTANSTLSDNLDTSGWTSSGNVISANYQISQPPAFGAPQGGISNPPATLNPPANNPNFGTPAPMAGQPSRTIPESMIQPSLPTYPSSPQYVTGEPYVTAPCPPAPVSLIRYSQAVPCTSYGVPGYNAPATLTPNMVPGMYAADNVGFRPLFTLGQENYNAVLGRGIIGQPTAYVPGQPLRNFMRYIFP